MQLDLEELSTVQKYISTLFDSIPPIQIHSPNIQSQLVSQNIHYGRKIIELSDKFTAKYRKDHFFDQREVENKIIQIYKIVSPHSYHENLDEMVNAILKTLQEEKQKPSHNYASRSSVNQTNSRITYAQPLQNQAIKESKVDYLRVEGEFLKHEQSCEKKNSEKLGKSKISSENNPHEEKRRKSVNRGKGKKGEDFSTKTVLQIKQFFEEEENTIRCIFEKIKKYMDENRMNVMEENLKFVKKKKESEQDNLVDFVKINTENNKENMQKIQKLIELMNDSLAKKLKHEGLAEGKFNLYLEEIGKREEVYSYAVSRLLENVNTLKESLSTEHKKSQYLRIIENIYELGEKFYELYPSHSILKDLRIEKVWKEMEKVGLKNQGVQASIGKSEKAIHREIAESKRNLLQLHKISTRVSENIDKFEKSIKYKKQIELKQVQRFLHNLKESFPKKNQVPAIIGEEVNSYQEQLRKLMEQNSKNEKEMFDDFGKKAKKQEKRIGELQRALDEALGELKREGEMRQEYKKKTSKKIQHEKQQNKRLAKEKHNLDKNLKQLTEELNRLQMIIKSEHGQFENAQKNLIEQNLQLIKSLEEKKGEKEEMRREFEEERRKMNEQREIYHQKIVILQTKQEEQCENTQKVKFELSEMIKQNESLKGQVEELSDVYEQKIKELEDLIENIKELQKQLGSQEVQIEELTEGIKIRDENITLLESELSKSKQNSERLEQSLEAKISEAVKYKEMGLLNDSDINLLKQEMEKVKDAYLQSEEQLQEVKGFVEQLQIQKDGLCRQNRNLKRELEETDNRWESLKLHRQKLQKENRENRDEMEIKIKEINQMTHEADQYKREISKLKKEILELREGLNKSDGEVRQIRQELQKKSEQESLQSGKRRLQLQATKVELRRKTEQLEKQKEMYEEKIQILEGKNRQMSQFISQKQLLARITNSHQSQ